MLKVSIKYNTAIVIKKSLRGLKLCEKMKYNKLLQKIS